MPYERYEYLQFEHRDDGVLLVTINRPEQGNAVNAVLHEELSSVWGDISRDERTRAVVITGAGTAFSAGGDLDLLEGAARDFKVAASTLKEASGIVYGILDCEKPVVSAINGAAVGAGLAVALMADISIAAEDARLSDGHVRIGLGAGDHSAIIWPLLCGMAKAKYYLLTADFLDGREAERIGLVSKCVARDEVVPTALGVAAKLAAGPQYAIGWTRKALNNWMRMAGPTFDASLAYEMLTFFGDDVAEGTRAFREKRRPAFPSAQS